MGLHYPLLLLLMADYGLPHVCVLGHGGSSLHHHYQ